MKYTRKELEQKGFSHDTIKGWVRHGKVARPNSRNSDDQLLYEVPEELLGSYALVNGRAVKLPPRVTSDTCKGPVKAADVEESQAPQEDKPVAFRDATFTYHSEVDERNKVVLCYAPMLKRPIRITFNQHRELSRAYSNYGAKMTVAQIGNQFGWAYPVARAVLKSLNLYHDSLPFTQEEIENTPEEDLVHELDGLRVAKILAASDRKRVKELSEAADALKIAEGKFRAMLTELNASDIRSSLLSKRGRAPAVNPYVIVDCITDAHVDAAGVDGNSVEEDMEVMTERMIDAAQKYTPSEIVILAGSDWLNADNAHATTTKGTQQFNSIPTYESPSYAWKLLKKRIVAWHNAFDYNVKIRIVLIPGNHDQYSTLFMELLCREAFAGLPNIEVTSERGTGRAYFNFGATSFGFTHGDTLKANRMLGVIRDEQKDLRDNIIWIQGHTHDFRCEALGPKAELITAPALSPTSHWTASNFGFRKQSGLLLAVSEDGNDVVRMELKVHR